MNPDSTIRVWLLACGQQYGLREAHDYRWPDAETRQHEIYATYRLAASRPYHDGTLDMSSVTGTTAERKCAQKWITTVEIDLYNSQDGLFELASMVVAARGNPEIRAIFNDQCSLSDVVSLQNLSEFDDERIDYHQRLIVTFEEDVTFALDEANGVVSTVRQQLESDSYNYSITVNGIT